MGRAGGSTIPATQGTTGRHRKYSLSSASSSSTPPPPATPVCNAAPAVRAATSSSEVSASVTWPPPIPPPPPRAVVAPRAPPPPTAAALGAKAGSSPATKCFNAVKPPFSSSSASFTSPSGEEGAVGAAFKARAARGVVPAIAAPPSTPIASSAAAFLRSSASTQVHDSSKKVSMKAWCMTRTFAAASAVSMLSMPI